MTTVYAAQRGDKQAFAMLYDSYSDALYGLIVRIVKSEEAGQDVLQEAFVKIWRNLPRYDSKKGTIFTWMLQISRNTAIDHLRSIKRKRTANLSGEDTKMGLSNSTSINTDAIGVEDMIERLLPEQQAVLRMIYFEGYTQRETSEELDLPLGTVKSRVRIAMRELRKLFVLLF